MMTPGGPGWNDPPSLSYETHTQTTGRRNLLTKRVGLPDLKMPEATSAKPPTQQPFAPPIMPPGPPPDGAPKTDPSGAPIGTKAPANKIAPPPVAIFNPLEPLTSTTKSDPEDPLEAPEKECESTTHIQDSSSPVAIFNPLGSESTAENEEPSIKVKIEETDIESMDINFITELRNIIEKCRESGSISTQVAQTITKKIDVLEKQKNENKLPEVVVVKMDKLTKHLMVKEFDKAWNIHLALVCDYSSSVMQWMVGVKRLISEAKKLQ